MTAWDAFWANNATFMNAKRRDGLEAAAQKIIRNFLIQVTAISVQNAPRI
jgi:hypothetical protein